MKEAMRKNLLLRMKMVQVLLLPLLLPVWRQQGRIMTQWPTVVGFL